MDLSFTDGELRMCQDFVVKLALEAGQIMRNAFSAERKEISEKSSSYDLVTETDAAVEKFLISSICEMFPNHRFIGEESFAPTRDHHSRLTDEPTWMIDPIDGTMNFIHRNNNVALSIGLVVQKTPILGVIYNPISNELFSARLGGGAHLNGRPIHVSQNTDLALSLLATDFGCVISQMPERLETAGKIVPKVHGIRAVGSSALHMAMVASGAVDCMYEFGLHCWDMAAGTILIREAGGVVMAPSGDDVDLMSRQVLCAATPKLALQLTNELNPAIFKFPRD